MTSSEGLRAPFLVPNPELQIANPTPHELRANPSDIATARMLQLRGSFTKSQSLNDGFSDMDIFLISQTLTYWDKLIVTLHSDEQTYQDFLNSAVTEYPTRYISNPGLYPTFPKETIPGLVDSVFKRDPDSLRTNFLHLPKVFSDEEVGCFSDELIEQTDKSEWYMRHLSMALIHSPKSLEDKQKLMQEALDSSQVIWYDIDGLYPSRNEKAAKRTKQSCIDMLDRIKVMIASDIVTADQLSENLDNLIAGKLGVNDVAGWTQRYALDAKMALRLNSILPQQDAEATVIDYLDKLESIEYDDFSSDFLAGLVKAGVVTREFMTKSILKYKERWISSLNYDLAIADCMEANPDLSYTQARKIVGEPLHYNDDVIRKLYQSRVVEGKTADFQDAFGDLLDYAGPLKELQRELTDLFLSEKNERGMALIVSSYHLIRLRRIYSDDLERLGQGLRRNLEITDHVKSEDWVEWSEIAGFSKQEVRDIFLGAINNEPFFGNIIRVMIGEALNSKDELFSLDEFAQIVKTQILTRECRLADEQNVLSFCEHWLGSELAFKYFGDLSVNDFPYLAAAINKEMTIDSIIDSGDYYDLYRVVSKMDDLPDLNNQSLMKKLVEAARTTLTADHLASFLPSLWPFMNGLQKCDAYLQLGKNPALFESYMASPSYKKILQPLVDLEECRIDQSGDRLMALAPKSYNTLQRRLKSAAKNEKRRAHIQEHYAYYYDLCLRLDGFEGASDFIPTFRGKKDIKHELRALEMLTLIHETTAIHASENLASMSKSELEELAVVGVGKVHGLGLNESGSLTANLRSQNIDIVKFAMWVHESEKSQKLKSYFEPFLKHLSGGGTLQEWKSSNPLGNNLPQAWPSKLKQDWMADEIVDLRYRNGQDISIVYSHSLESVYLSGSRPSDNCLHYAFGINQRSLVGMLNADSKAINILNRNNKVIGNAILRLSEDTSGNPVLCLEPLYTSLSSDYDKWELSIALIGSAAEYGRKLDVPVKVLQTSYGDIADVAAQYFRKTGKDAEYIKILPSLAPFSHVDAFRTGKKSVLANVV